MHALAGERPGGRRPGSLAHLLRLTDDVGLLEHADHAVPRVEHGYCVDDNARAVVVVERALTEVPGVAGIFDRYVEFVLAAQAPDGRFHNRLDYAERRWLDPAGTGDWWGRAMWAMGHVAARRPTHRLAERARAAFVAGANHRSAHRRAMAFAALGAAELHRGAASPHEASVAAEVLNDAVTVIGRPGEPGWPWPEPRLTYANARLPEALIAAGTTLHHATALNDGLALLGWLADVETRGAMMSFTPVGGWAPGEPRPAFDQQPIEAWAMAAAAARASRATGDERWATLVAHCDAWFTGANDRGVPVVDLESGGGCDGLTADGRNENQGAESTLAFIATRQIAQRGP